MKFLVFDFVLFLCFMQVLCQDSTQLSSNKNLHANAKENRNNTSNSINQLSYSKTKLENVKNVVCPDEGKVNIPFLSLPCDYDSECLVFGKQMVCCYNRCIRGVFASIAKSSTNVDRSLDVTTQPTVTEKQISKNDNFVCPNKDTRILFFSLPCGTNSDCQIFGSKMVCCSKKCLQGIPRKEEQKVQSTPKEKLATERNDSVERSNDLPTKIVIQSVTTSPVVKDIGLVCPHDARIPFFSLLCTTDNDCSASGEKMVCCKNRCIKGVHSQKHVVQETASWFGLVERNCPVDAIVEILEVRECETDADCRPRICCPDKYRSGGNKSYCRTPQPSLQRFPLADRATEPLRVFASYIQCTPPPPPIFDLFPKSCNNALDCFPNLCCQEGDKKYCRPPKRSVLQLVAGLGQRFIPPDAAKKLIERLN
ncbi:uncharacterized protein LOC123686061 isoform X3 [Harmonia axyridis]|uniref:uncharacterized protein LOC123686061 isoform X3 n=1 Tax=Harmonia axyridis TaxID=115357 RepID=UPI001E27601B|nr:uncharacterized protein LOC123686061 isoform X3 [Harmonia axyridis]